MHLYDLNKQVVNTLTSFSGLFHSEWKSIFFTDNVHIYMYCVYSAMSKNLKQLTNFTVGTSIIPIIFKGVLLPCYTVTISYHSLYINQVPGNTLLYAVLEVTIYSYTVQHYD
jgi:hypothetical protein